jgi:glucosamine--fructose-6-phosphate aminotransferase (isomerizing)
MCGIIAGISENICTILLEGLYQLQNRGYDSAGLSLLHMDKTITTFKKASSHKCNALLSIKEFISKGDLHNETVGIAHTRWATHGAKTDTNSHPHLSQDGKFTVVHNGIIENYKKIQEFLKEHGYINSSETDTECIANLLSYYYHETEQSVEEALRQTLNDLEGTWGLVIICKDTPNTLYCTRQGSPLLVGHSDKSVLVTSEQSGFCGRIQNYFVLENNDICITHKDEHGKIAIHTSVKNYENKDITVQNNALTPDPYPYWMLKEIYEQPNSVNNVIKQGSRLLDTDKVHLGGLNQNEVVLSNIDHIILLGCGTSLNAAKFAIHYFKSLCGFSSITYLDGADFGVDDISQIGNTALILLSQSGETKDLHRCIDIANQHNLFTIGVVNVVDSLISREVECGCYLHAGREVGVASTKSFTSQCILLVMIAVWFSQIQEPRVKKNLYRKRIIKDIRSLSADIEKVLTCHTQVKTFMNDFNQHPSCFVLGKGKGEAIAHEGSLKIKEISYIHAEGYSTSSLKHGPFALLEKDFPVILICPNDEHAAKSQNAYEELKSRFARVIRITDSLDGDIVLPKNDTFVSLLAIIPIQLLSYELALIKNNNPDMPRNLAKVVTVE